MSAHFLISNKVQNVRQHNFETNKGLIFDYAHLQQHILSIHIRTFDFVLFTVTLTDIFRFFKLCVKQAEPRHI